MRIVKSFFRLVSVGSIFLLGIALASSYAAVDITYTSNKATVGTSEQFTLTVTADVSGGPLGTFGGQIFLDFDNNALQIASVSTTVAADGGFPMTLTPRAAESANGDGSFNWSYASLSFPAPTIADGNYTIGTIVFSVANEGVTGFDTSRTSIRDDGTGTGSILGNVTLPDVTISGTGATEYTVTFAAGANGTITGTSPQTVAVDSSTTAVEAVANTGYVFDNWTDTGSFSSTDNPLTVTPTMDMTITANFKVSTVPAAPSFTPATGTELTASPGSITITPATDAAATYYTLDGSAPDNTSTALSGTTVSVSGADGASVTVNAVSYNATGAKGTVGTATYSFNIPGPAAPALSSTGGTVTASPTDVTVTPAADAVNTYYTLDGTTPNANSTPLSGPIPVSGANGESVTLKVVSVDANGDLGPVSTATYTFSLGGGSTDLGDADGKGDGITIYDALAVAQAVVGLPPAGFDATKGNVNCGELNLQDAVDIAKIVAELTTIEVVSASCP